MKIKRTRLILTILAKIAGGYLISQGQAETGALLIAAAGGTYNVGQSMRDAAEIKAGQAVNDAVEELINR